MESPMRARGRGDLSSARLAEHLRTTVIRLRKFGVNPGDTIASLLPDCPDSTTLQLALGAFPGARLVDVENESELLEAYPSFLLAHPGEHPRLRQVASILGICVVNVLRHFEAGVFTLEAALSLPRAGEVPPPPSPSWKNGVPLVLIAPGAAYCQLAKRLDARNPVIGIMPPSLELMSLPSTIENIAAECVRMLRRCRAHGPYALAGWRAEGLVALEMARQLEEEGEKIAFVALLDASSLFRRPVGRVGRALSFLSGLLRSQQRPYSEVMEEALREYRPVPWFGKILHIHPRGEQSQPQARFEWRDIAPHGVQSFDAPGEILAEPNVETVARILAAQFDRTPKESTPQV